jgi:hypothetical protein
VAYPLVPNSNVQIDRDALVGGNVWFGGAINATAAPTALAGTTAGTAYWIQVEQGTTKRVVVALVGYENTTATAQTITFPTPFAYEAAVVYQPTSFGATVGKTTLTLPASMASAVSGVIVVEGI